MSDWTIPNPDRVATAIRQSGFELMTRAGLDINAVRTWDDRLGRQQRLMVPIDVQAYVVDDDSVEATVGVAGLPDDPDPFDPGSVRARGVHLHWAMPDGLARGVQTGDGTSVEFPLLPDRWVVVRTVLPIGRERVLTRGWVIDAGTKVVVGLGEFDGTFPPPADEEDRLDRLDAAFGGGLLWTASYEASHGRFAFHDPLDDIAALTAVAADGLHRDMATYTVCGWWGDVNDDILAGTSGVAAVDDRLDGLGWHVDHEGRDELQPDDYRHTNLEQMGFRSLRDGPGVVVQEGSTSHRPSAPIEVSVASPIPGAENVVVGTARLRYLTLLHGSVLGVPLGQLPTTDGRPGAGSVKVAAGLDIDDLVAALGSAALSTVPGERESAERLAAAFTGDLLEQLSSPDGLSDLSQREHDDGFWPLTGPPLPDVVPDQLRVADSGSIRPTGVGRKGRSAHSRRVAAPRSDAAGSGAERSPDGFARDAPGVGGLFFEPHDQRRTASVTDTLSASAVRELNRLAEGIRSVTRPAPRVFRPQAPMVGLRNLRPSHRHHGDGLYDDSGKLRIRYPSELGDGSDGPVRGADVLPTLGSGAIPPEVLRAVREAVALDPYAERWLAEAAVAGTGISVDVMQSRLSAEFARLYGSDASYDGTGTAFLRSPANGGPVAPQAASATATWAQQIDPRMRLVESQVAAEASRLSVIAFDPSPVAITTWRQPWVPLWVEWEVRVAGGANLDGWTLGSHDFEPTEQAGVAPGEGVDHTFLGRSPISRSVGRALHEGIKRWLEAEQRRDAALDSTISDPDELALSSLGGLLSPIDVVSASLDGVREQLLGIDYVGQIARATGPDGVARPVADKLPDPLFAGRLELTRLRVVDAFGRTLDVNTDEIRTTTTLEVDDAANAIMLRPRLQHSARWLFRLVDPAHPIDADPLGAKQAFVHQVEPALAVNPVAGFVLPDHIDEALEFFDADGAPLGQLDHDGLSGAVRWEASPGRPLPPDAGPLADLEPRSQLLGMMALGLNAADVATRGPDLAAADVPDESPLSVLLRAIDTTLWSVDSFAAVGTPSVAGLIGRPVAVVRATLRLEVFDDVDEVEITEPGGAADRRRRFESLNDQQFPVRLGDLARSDDALLGFYVDDDYTRLHVVDRVVRAQAIDTGRHRGHLGLLGSAASLGERPLDHPSIVQEDELLLRPGQTVRLTMLMLPGGRVHLTSGILPRKALGLADDWVRRGLVRMAPSVRVGPLLIDPGDVRLPKVHVLGEEQSFTRRTGPLTWRDDPIVSATQAALLPRLPHELQEGWIRVTPTAANEEGDS